MKIIKFLLLCFVGGFIFSISSHIFDAKSVILFIILLAIIFKFLTNIIKNLKQMKNKKLLLVVIPVYFLSFGAMILFLFLFFTEKDFSGLIMALLFGIGLLAFKKSVSKL